MAKGIQFLKGGKGKMFGKTGAGTQTPGQSAKKSGPGPKFAAGGKTKMFGKSGAMPAKGSC